MTTTTFETAQLIPIAQLAKEVSKALGEDFNSLCQKSRKQNVVEARYLSWYFIVQLHPEEISLRTMGALFGNYAHTSVLRGLRNSRNWIKYNEPFKNKVLMVKTRLAQQKIEAA